VAAGELMRWGHYLTAATFHIITCYTYFRVA
jgi:hypothetical protein